MNRSKRGMTVILTLALGLGVWAVSFTYQAATFADGDVLSAAALNALLNDNFEGVLANRVDIAGDSMTGPLHISGAATAPSDGAALSTLAAVNSGEAGSAAYFEVSNAAGSQAAVSIANAGSGPAIAIKASGTGPIISAITSKGPVFEVADTGSIKLGLKGGQPTLVLDAVAGTVTNAVGSGLPFGFGRVFESGAAGSGTDNWSATWNAGSGRYEVTFTDTSYSVNNFVTMVTPITSTVRSFNADSQSGKLVVTLRDAGGTAVQGQFAFTTFKAP